MRTGLGLAAAGMLWMACASAPASSSKAQTESTSSTTASPRARPAPSAERRPASPPPTARPARVSASPFAVDPNVDLKARWSVVPNRTWQTVTYRGSAGDRIPALFRAARRPGRRPAIILGHGHGGDARSMARFFGSLLSRRVHVLAVNHPYSGHDRKVPGEDICPRDARRLVKRWIRAVRDLRYAARLLAERPDVDPQRIGYLGFSLGACLGALFVAHEPRVRAAALVSPAGTWSVLAATDSYWHIGWHHQPLAQWLRDPTLRAQLAIIDPARSIARFAPRPLLVVVGQRDKVIRDISGLTVFRAAGKGKRLIHHPGGHGPGRTLRRRVTRWLERQLYGETPPAR